MSEKHENQNNNNNFNEEMANLEELLKNFGITGIPGINNLNIEKIASAIPQVISLFASCSQPQTENQNTTAKVEKTTSKKEDNDDTKVYAKQGKPNDPPKKESAKSAKTEKPEDSITLDSESEKDESLENFTNLELLMKLLNQNKINPKNKEQFATELISIFQKQMLDKLDSEALKKDTKEFFETELKNYPYRNIIENDSYILACVRLNNILQNACNELSNELVRISSKYMDKKYPKEMAEINQKEAEKAMQIMRMLDIMFS